MDGETIQRLREVRRRSIRHNRMRAIIVGVTLVATFCSGFGAAVLLNNYSLL